jgi:hypothetical protein
MPFLDCIRKPTKKGLPQKEERDGSAGTDSASFHRQMENGIHGNGKGFSVKRHMGRPIDLTPS